MAVTPVRVGVCINDDLMMRMIRMMVVAVVILQPNLLVVSIDTYNGWSASDWSAVRR